MCNVDGHVLRCLTRDGPHILVYRGHKLLLVLKGVGVLVVNGPC